MRPTSVHASGDGTAVSVRDGGAAVGSDASVVGIPVACGAAGVPTAAATSGARLDHSLGPAHHPSAAGSGVADVRTAADLAHGNRGGPGGPERDLEGVIAGLEDEFRQLNARYSAVLAQSQVGRQGRCVFARNQWFKRQARPALCAATGVRL